MPRLAENDGAAAIAAVLRGAAVGAVARPAGGDRSFGVQVSASLRSPDSPSEASATTQIGESTMTELPSTEDLAALFAALGDLGIDAVLVGGIAMLRYVEGRNTEDVDLIVSEESMGRIPGFVLLDRNLDAVRGRFRSIRVDLLASSTPVFGMVAARHSTRIAIGGASVGCATPHGLAILKLFALPNLYRSGSLSRAALYETDLLALLREAGVDLDAALAELGSFIGPGDLAELRAVVEEVQERARRLGLRGHGRQAKEPPGS